MVPVILICGAFNIPEVVILPPKVAPPVHDKQFVVDDNEPPIETVLSKVETELKHFSGLIFELHVYLFLRFALMSELSLLLHLHKF